MIRGREIRSAWRLTRPDQWTILTFQFLVPVMLLAPAARGGGCWFNPASGLVLLSAWMAWVVFLNGGTLAFNSAYDRDTGPVAYLANPPQPPSWLAAASLLFMLLGTALTWWTVGAAFTLGMGICVLLSVLYSHPRFRWKARPGLDLLVNMLGYGAGTTLAGLLAARAAYFGADNACAAGGWRFVSWPGLTGTIGEQFGSVLAGGPGWIVLGFGLLFGSFYPLTQLYQMDEDRQRGDKTLCTALGPRLSLILAVVLGLLASGALVSGLLQREAGWSMSLPIFGLILWLAHLADWLRREPGLSVAGREKGMYRALTLWALVDITLVLGWYL